jgi:dihydroorotase
MSTIPNERFSAGRGEMLGEKGSFTVFSLDSEYEIDPEKFLSKGRNTPFGGRTVFGKCLMTVYNGKIAYNALEK